MNFFLVGEVFIRESQGAWDKERRDGNRTSGKNNFLVWGK